MRDVDLAGPRNCLVFAVEFSTHMFVTIAVALLHFTATAKREIEYACTIAHSHSAHQEPPDPLNARFSSIRESFRKWFMFQLAQLYHKVDVDMDMDSWNVMQGFESSRRNKC